jgi:hypothetical protein
MAQPTACGRNIVGTALEVNVFGSAASLALTQPDVKQL